MNYTVCVELKGVFGSSIEYFNTNNIKELDAELKRNYKGYRIIGITGVKR